MEIGDRVTQLETVVFDKEGNKGLNTQFQEFKKDWWIWHDHGRQNTCHYLKDKEKRMDQSRWNWNKLFMVIKEVVIIATLIFTIIKLFQIGG